MLDHVAAATTLLEALTWGKRGIRLLETSQRETRSRVTDPRDLVQLFTQELLVGSGPGHGYFDEVVEIARQQVRFHDLGQFRERRLEALEHLVVMTLERDVYDGGVGQPKRPLVEDRDVAFDDSLLLQVA